ncbi:MAG: response regulator transcription factor [Eubacteriales bacterium]|nr:response regulator transcription factor [Eubacteriales bacterium]
MIPIYLCEDDPDQLAILQEMIQKYIFIQAYDMQISCAARSAGEMLSAMPSKPESAIYFLDIQLGEGMDGIELASLIRRRDPRAYIIFTTTHSEMALTAFRYQVEPLDFLIKDEAQYGLRILHCLRNILEKSQSRTGPANGRFHIRLPDQDLFVPFCEILCIRAAQTHRITVYTVRGIYQCGGALNEALEKLDQAFFICHKCCLVNTAHIRALHRRPCRIELDDGTICPCAQRRFSQLQKLMGASA